jgi:hypothetical protein
MRKICFLLSFSLVLAVTCLPAGAATVTGEILDQATGLALANGGQISAYKWNSGTSGWDPAGTAYLGTAQTTFKIGNLQAGTYYFIVEASNYVTEYYNNIFSLANKTQVTLTQSQTKTLAKIYLRPLPIRLTDFQITGIPVPHTGGTVTLKCTLVNDSASAKTVLVWPRIAPYRTIYGSTFMSDSFQGTSPKSVTVAANSKKAVGLSVPVPGNAPSGYMADIFMNCGASIWLPLTREVYIGSIVKEGP